MAAPWGQAGGGRPWPGWGVMTGDREDGEWQGERGDCQGPASTVVQAPCPRLAASISCSGIFPCGGGSISEKGKESLRVLGFLRTVSTFSQNCLPQTCPQAPA